MQDFLNGISLLPEKYKNVLSKVPSEIAEKVNEIRFRVEDAVVLQCGDNVLYISECGRVTRFYCDGLLKTDLKDMQNIVFMLSRRSIHTYQEMIAKGFIPLRGGCKAGVVGRAVIKNNSVYSVSDFSSVNIRISREIKGCAKELLEAVGDCTSYIIIGPPMSGKTTLLRDLCRSYSGRNMQKPKKVTVIDERDEIASKFFGSYSDIDTHVDVLTLYPKAVGVEIAVRTLSPDIIVLDEIGAQEDALALLAGVNSGVDFIATAHGNDFNEAMRRPNIKKLINSGVFKKAVILEGKNEPCKVKGVVSL